MKNQIAGVEDELWVLKRMASDQESRGAEISRLNAEITALKENIKALDNQVQTANHCAGEERRLKMMYKFVVMVLIGVFVVVAVTLKSRSVFGD